MSNEFKPIETQEEFDAMVQDRVNREKNKAEKEMKARAAEIETAQKALDELQTETASLKDRIKELETERQTSIAEAEQLKERATAAELKTEKLRIAAEYGLPALLADRLTGDNAEAIRADAEALKKTIGTKTHVAPLAGESTREDDPVKAGIRQMVQNMHGE